MTFCMAVGAGACVGGSPGVSVSSGSSEVASSILGDMTRVLVAVGVSVGVDVAEGVWVLVCVLVAVGVLVGLGGTSVGVEDGVMIVAVAICGVAVAWMPGITHPESNSPAMPNVPTTILYD